MVNISSTDGGGLASQPSGVAVSYPPEYRDLRTNTFVLTRLAERTRGQVLSNPAQVFTGRRRPARVPIEVWPALLLAALLLFPLDVALRRVMVEPAEARAWAEERASVLRRRRARKPRQVPVRPPTLGRLLDRKAAATPARGSAGPQSTAGGGDASALSPTPSPRTVPPGVAAGARPTGANPEEENLSPTERLLRAKRRARGE